MQAAGQDHVGALGLETDDRTAGLRVLCPVHLDLAVDLVTVQDRPLDHVWVIGCQLVIDRSDVGHRASHGHQCVRRWASVESGEIIGDRLECRGEHIRLHGIVETEILGVAHRADRDAETLYHLVTFAEGELRASPSGVEHHQRATIQIQARP